MNIKVLIVAVGVLIYLLFTKKKEGFTIASPASGPSEQCANFLLANVDFSITASSTFKILKGDCITSGYFGDVMITLKSSARATYSLMKEDQLIDQFKIDGDMMLYLPFSLFKYNAWNLTNLTEDDNLTLSYGLTTPLILQIIKETGCWMSPNGYKVFF